METLHKLLTLSSLMMLNFIHSGQAVTRTNHQVMAIGHDDPCADELGVDSPSDNLSCPFGERECYNRSELCNGNHFCSSGYDEGEEYNYWFPYSLKCEL